MPTGPATAEPARIQVASAGGVTLAGYRWDPPGEARAVAQLTHGMGEHALRYDRLARALTKRGYVVFAQDHRGHGATVASPEEQGVIGEQGWAELVTDIDRVRLAARREHSSLPLALVAHSMGSFAAQQYLLDHSGDVDAVVLTGTAAIDLLEPALDLDARIDLSGFNAPFAPARTDYDWLSRDEAEVDAYVADPRCGFGLDAAGGKAMFAGAREVAVHERLTNMRRDLPVLVATGEQDPVNGSLELVTTLVERLQAAGLVDVTLTLYDAARHELFNETNRDEVTGDVLAWLEDRLFAKRA